MRIVRRQRGFTLIELLVVIAIIAVLAAILLPVVWKARENARQTHCVSNLHQLAVALKAYWQEYRAYPPPPHVVITNDVDGDGIFDPGDGDQAEWRGGLSALVPDFISTSKILICPDDKDATSRAVAVQAKNYSSYNGPPYVLDPATGYLVPDFTYEPPSGSWQHGGYNYYGYTNGGQPCSGKPCESSPGVPGVPCSDPAAADHHILDMSVTHTDPHLADADADGVPDKTDIPSLAKFPRLMNRYAPDNTIIVHCTHHRTLMSNKPENQRDLAINLGGSYHKISWLPWSQPNRPGTHPENGVPFVYQPPL